MGVCEYVWVRVCVNVCVGTGSKNLSLQLVEATFNLESDPTTISDQT